MSRPDNSQYLQRWREERREAATRRVRETLDGMDARGEQPTFAAVANSAGVSRSWLYTSSFADEIRQRRSSPPPRVPRSTAPSDASLKARLTDALEEVARLRKLNAELNRQLELALGRQRNG